MNTIYIYDVSALIKSGTYSSQGKEYGKPKKDFNFFSFPTGGLYTFTERFLTDYKASKSGDIFIACFDGTLSKYPRTLRYPEYKANRKIAGYDDVDVAVVDKSDITQTELLIASLDAKTQEKVIRRAAAGIQLKLLKTILPTFGVNVLHSPEMEADDWIYSVCKLAGSQYNILLRADDGDLDDCIVYAPNLRKWSVSGRQELRPTPGKNFIKIFHGEKSDNIPNPCTHFSRKLILAVQEAIESGLEDATLLLNKQRLMEVYHLPQEAADMLEMNTFLVTPQFVSNLQLHDEPLDEAKMIEFFSAFRLKRCVSRLNAEYSTAEDVTNIQKFAFSLLPRYVKDFYSKKEFTDSTIDRTVLDTASKSYENTEEYLLQAAAKYNILQKK